MPRGNADAMARALGDPPRLWLPTNHFGIALLPERLYRLARDFLGAEMRGSRFPRTRLREYAVPAVKAGVFTGLESRLTAGAGVEYPLLFTRHNRPMLSVEGLWTGRGMFVGITKGVGGLANMGVMWNALNPEKHYSTFISWSLAF